MQTEVDATWTLSINIEEQNALPLIIHTAFLVKQECRARNAFHTVSAHPAYRLHVFAHVFIYLEVTQIDVDPLGVTKWVDPEAHQDYME